MLTCCDLFLSKMVVFFAFDFFPLQISVAPWASAYMKGDFSVSILIADAGMELAGFFMNFKSSANVTVVARQLPLEIT